MNDCLHINTKTNSINLTMIVDLPLLNRDVSINKFIVVSIQILYRYSN